MMLVIIMYVAFFHIDNITRAPILGHLSRYYSNMRMSLVCIVVASTAAA